MVSFSAGKSTGKLAQGSSGLSAPAGLGNSLTEYSIEVPSALTIKLLMRGTISSGFSSSHAAVFKTEASGNQTVILTSLLVGFFIVKTACTSATAWNQTGFDLPK